MLLLEAERRIFSGDRRNPRVGERSLDECRALLYAFYLSSTLVPRPCVSENIVKQRFQFFNMRPKNRWLAILWQNGLLLQGAWIWLVCYVSFSCYLIETESSSKRHDSLWIKILKDAAECEADLILVACARFQSIADSVYRALPHRLSNSDGRNAPLWMHTSHLKNEMQSIFINLSSDLQNHR